MSGNTISSGIYVARNDKITVWAGPPVVRAVQITVCMCVCVCVCEREGGCGSTGLFRMLEHLSSLLPNTLFKRTMWIEKKLEALKADFNIDDTHISAPPRSCFMCLGSVCVFVHLPHGSYRHVDLIDLAPSVYYH